MFDKRVQNVVIILNYVINSVYVTFFKSLKLENMINKNA